MIRIHQSSKRFWRGVLSAVVSVVLLYGLGYTIRSYFGYLARKDIVLPPTPDAWLALAREPQAWDAGNQSGNVIHAALRPARAMRASGSRGVALPDQDRVDVIRGDYVLTVSHVFVREQLMALAQRHGLPVLGQFENTIRIRVSDRQRLAMLLREVPGVVDVEANVRMRIPLLDDAGDSLPAPATPYRGFGDQALAWLGIPEPDEAWGRGIKVAVLDTGIKGIPVAHRMRFVDENEYGGHGSLVAGILVSLLPGADLVDMQVMGADGMGDTYTVAKGIRAAVDAGAQIINMSIGTRGQSRVLAEAVQYAIDQGVLLVASAGNEGVARVSYPAAYDGVLSVAAVDAEEQHVHFSNRGDRVDVAAPGVGVAVTLHDGETASFAGTSAAAPFVSATAGLALTMDPSLPGQALQALLVLHANDTGQPGENALTGSGIVSPLRVSEHNQPGIVDMGVLRPHFDTDASGQIQGVTVAAQNRGTVDLGMVEMVVSINDQAYHLAFEDVGRGQTVAYRLEMDRERPAGVMDVTVQVQVPGDLRPENNALRSVHMPVSLDGH